MDLTLGSSEACQKQVDDLLQRLDVDPKKGLSDAEAARRRRVYGDNTLARAEKESSWKKYFQLVRACLCVLGCLCLYVCICVCVFVLVRLLFFWRQSLPFPPLTFRLLLLMHKHLFFFFFFFFFLLLDFDFDGLFLGMVQFKEPLNLLLLSSALISVLMGQYDDAFSITLVRRAVVDREKGVGIAVSKRGRERGCQRG